MLKASEYKNAARFARCNKNYITIGETLCKDETAGNKKCFVTIGNMIDCNLCTNSSFCLKCTNSYLLSTNLGCISDC